jgi:pyridoxal 5'-phosphate synthase pdxT subunit
MAKIGVLALQGAFREHAEAFDALEADVVLVKRAEQLSGLDAIVLPGGESTTQTKLLDSFEMRQPLVEALHDGLACFATCAGLILLAHEVLDGRSDQVPLGLIDVSVRRNGYGRQVASFEAPLQIVGLDAAFTGVFIRAPRIERIGSDVEVLATHDADPVLVRRGRIVAAGFHPELAADLRVHQLFLNTVSQTRGGSV